ncbi:hypothetical protein [Alistipes sp. ZOR0009]|uniref:hypothetical protein n=1 Tax=Alistipes sp. ZOR0009 TaxID=1339253 RepID=UPI0012E02E11|nr:hypothetical protein [Alistipes sp. ZOR0009]
MKERIREAPTPPSTLLKCLRTTHKWLSPTLRGFYRTIRWVLPNHPLGSTEPSVGFHRTLRWVPSNPRLGSIEPIISLVRTQATSSISLF